MGNRFQLDGYNGEPVVTEPGLRNCEQETWICFFACDAKDGFFRISSSQAPIVRGLLSHKDYIADEIGAIGPEDAPRVVSTQGRLPINCLRITSAKGSMSVGKIITQSARGVRGKVTCGSSCKTPDTALETRDKESGSSKQEAGYESP